MIPPEFDAVTSFGALLAAAGRAARGKRDRAPVATWLTDVEREILRLQDELRSGRYQPGTAHTFTIYEPKRRTISAAPFRDRVVHHAVCAALEPLLERAASNASFACRRGLGPCASLDHVQALARRHSWVLRLDVRAFFASIEHDRLLAALRLRVQDARLLALVERIVRSGGLQGRGLPIGSLTSQHLANFYLAPVDGFIQRSLRLGYARYMDDSACFADDKATLWAGHARIQAFMADRLGLALKARATRVMPVSEGVPWLGVRVWPAHRRLDAAHVRRLARALAAIRRGLDAGRLSEELGQARAAGVLGFAAHAGTRAWCRAYAARRAEGRGQPRGREVRDGR